MPPRRVQLFALPWPPARAARRPRAASAAAALAALVSLGGCGSKADAPGQTSHGSRLTIYASAPLTGPGRRTALDLVRGERLALGEAGGRVGRSPVRLEVLDDAAGRERWTPANVAANARRAVQDRSAVAYLGESDTGGSAISLALLNEEGLVQVSPTDTFAGLTEPEGSVPGEPQKYYPKGNRTFGRIPPDDNVQARALVDWMSRLGVERVLILRDNSLAGGSLGDELGQQAERRRLTVADRVTVDVTTADLTGLQTQVRAADPDAVFFAGTEVGYGTRLWRALHQAVPHAKLFAPAALALPAFLRHLGGAERATYVPSAALPPAVLGPGAARFAQRFAARYHAAPGPSAAYGYEAMGVVLDALRRAGPKLRDRPTVVSELFKTRRPDSPLGSYALRRSGASTLSAYGGYRVRGGRPRFRLVLDARAGAGGGASLRAPSPAPRRARDGGTRSRARAPGGAPLADPR